MLTRRMQFQAIANMRVGIKSELQIAQFDDDLRGIAQSIIIDPDNADQAMERALLGCKNAQIIMQSILQCKPGKNGSRDKSVSLAEMAQDLQPIRYLWKNWIPLGMITLFGAMPGAGKSMIALDLCKRIIHGEDWPDGESNMFKGRKVIYVDAELVPQITLARASAWSMDMTKIYMLMPEQNDMIDLMRENDRDRLVEMVHDVKPILVVIDSLSSISSKGENAVEDVRQILSFLNALAGDYGIGLVLIHHLRKRNPLAFMDLVTQDDFRGSSHIIAMSRSVMALSIIQSCKERDPNGPRRIEIVKNNLNRIPEPMGVVFKPMHPSGVLIEYTDPPEKYREPSEVERCMEWLIETLSSGPMSISELEEEQMYNRRTIIRARERMADKIENTKGHQAPDNKWKLVTVTL
jgi:hypothetical protein